MFALFWIHGRGGVPNALTSHAQEGRESPQHGIHMTSEVKMKTLIRSLLATTVLLMLAITPPAFSQTPDGLTPAEESVCDPLADATPGLYGLCVAYCEAHDADLISLYGDPNELNIPNQRILANYNRKKTESDPAMPCVLQEGGEEPLEACPCWTAEQLEEMMPPTTNYDYNYPNACSASSSTVLENFEYGASGPAYQLAVYSYEGCAVQKLREYVGGPPSGFSGLSSEEEDSCTTLLTNHARKYSSPGVVWDCFDQ
jgi:hypothetical protein